MKQTQSDRVLAFIKANPMATSMDISMGCSPWVANAWARISDLRARGYVIEPVRRPDGKTGFVLQESAQRTLGLTA